MAKINYVLEGKYKNEKLVLVHHFIHIHHILLNAISHPIPS